MIRLDKQQLEKILAVKITRNSFSIEGIVTDSREVKPGNLFITWQGENFDGHKFCQQAVNQGAAALLINRPLTIDVPQIIVEDSIFALGRLAAYWRDRFSIPVIGVTGSNGKTTVKNMLSAILQEVYGNKFLAPKKSYNNHVGVPLTLSALALDHQAAIIEMGMNHFRELSYITKLAKPTVAMITNAGPSHLAGEGDIAGVAKAKGEIIEGLAPEGTAILNVDDAYFSYWQGLLSGQRVISFGLEQPAMVTAKAIHLSPEGCKFLLVTPQGEKPVCLPLLGKHNILNALAASAAALAININLEAIKAGLEKVEPENRRLQRKAGYHGALLIDDSYNANPNSMHKAIDVLKQFPGKRFLLIGDMRELGPEAKRYHQEIGHYAKEAGIEELYAVGDLMQNAVQAFGNNAKHFDQKINMTSAVKPFLDKNSVVLVKASLSMGFDEVITQLSQ